MLFTPAFMLSDSYDPDAVSLFARMSSQPNGSRKNLISKTIKALKAAGVWSQLDALYIFAAHDSQAALLNWVSTSYNATAVSSPTFTIDRGFQGNGSSSYIDTNFNPATASSPKYVRDSAHLSVWNLTDGIRAYPDLGNETSGNTILYLGYDLGALTCMWNLNQSSSDVYYPLSDALGLYVLNRASSAFSTLFKNGSKIADGSRASANPTNSKITFLKSTSTVYSNRRFAAGSIGASLTNTQVSDFNTILQTYMTAVGA